MTERVKELEARGYTFEAADASFELLLREEVEGVRPTYFEVESWRVIIESRGPGRRGAAEATVKVRAGGARIVAVGEGNGPVNALDQALRQAVEQLYPEIAKLELIDYKVRIIDAAHGTDAMTRVLIETSDGDALLGDRRRRQQRGRGLLEGAHRRPDVRPAQARRLTPTTAGRRARETRVSKPVPRSSARARNASHPAGRDSIMSGC